MLCIGLYEAERRKRKLLNRLCSTLNITIDQRKCTLRGRKYFFWCLSVGRTISHQGPHHVKSELELHLEKILRVGIQVLPICNKLRCTLCTEIKRGGRRNKFFMSSIRSTTSNDSWDPDSNLGRQQS